MRKFTTPKGTELELTDIKGKDYLTVQQRIIWFLEENPSFVFLPTEFKVLTATEAVATVTIQIFNENGRVIRQSTGTKHESKAGFSDFTEKAETGAIGRALANLGYGTQFATPDYAEGERVVDSPRTQPQPASGTGTASKSHHVGGLLDKLIPVMNLPSRDGKPAGKYLGKRYRDVPVDELVNTAHWFKDKIKNLNKWQMEFISDVEELQSQDDNDFAPPDERIPF